MCLLYSSVKCVTSITLCKVPLYEYLNDVSLLSQCAIQQIHYTDVICHFCYTIQYIRTITLMQCVTSITFRNISEPLYLGNVSLLFFFFFNRLCNPCGIWPAVLSLSILSRRFLQSAVASGTSNPQPGGPVTSITPCNISQLLQLRNLSLTAILHCAIYQNYYTYGMCPSYYTVHYIKTVIIMQCVTSLSLCNT